MALVPMVLEREGNSERSFDLFSKMLKDRIIFLQGEVKDDMANLIVSQLLFLEAQDPKTPITLYINSPGGNISSGLAIFDTINYIKCDVSTICIGLAASMGAFLLASASGKRYALKHSEIMIHQPYGGMKGVVSDIDIQTKRLLKTKALMNELLAFHTKKRVEIIEHDTERDYYMSAQEALDYNIIDEILESRKI